MINIKNEDQINRIRESCHLLADTFDEIEKHIEAGISTLELNNIADDFIRRNGGIPSFLGYGGFPGAICASVNDTVIHGIPDKTKLRNGDVIGIDMGINLNGYFSDRAVTYSVGTVEEDVRKLLRITEESLYKAIEAAVAGNRIKDISKAVTNHIEPYGYGVVYDFCGHGVGLAVHEDPSIPNYYPYRGFNPRIKPGMVLAIEPMINLGTDEVEVLEDDWTVKTLDRKTSAHFEHTIAIFKDHTEILTRK
ncbi:type I methionyl aminopeptidase [Spirochaeta isovalerica]|uniref:Methionine aminopeptidase n=1 Tax=Spirochaeta isovalerica TaxID=150 RepID=A0A841R6B5_9SPIO|nr:type I methionyl aminopeptidase [Spirochaeta isovalerica]MBB6478549.1 methionyl aminopeptidase [Spirochaeta isovalerica]